MSTVNQINEQVTTYAPLVMAGIQAAEQSTMSGANKKQAVLDGIQSASGTLAASTKPDVAAIGAMINMFVSIFNALGIFKKKPATPGAPGA